LVWACTYSPVFLAGLSTFNILKEPGTTHIQA
jgi:hypothetical protein